MKHIHTFESYLNEAKAYGLFNDAQGKPSKLSQEILDFCQKGLPKDVVDNIAEVEAAGYGKTNMITPPSTSNKGQSRGELDYTTIYIHFSNTMGRNKIKGMTVGLRKRTSGPGTGYVAISLDGVPGGTFAGEFYNKPEDELAKLWNENVKPLL
jgi:hypothetical protein